MKTKLLLLAVSFFSAGLLAPPLSAQNYTFTTLAGGSAGLLDAANTNALFSGVAGVAVDVSGNLYVADQNNNAIRKVTPSGTNWLVTTIAGGTRGSLDGANTNAQFFGPSSIALDSSGKLYVADEYNTTVRLLTPVGTNWVVTTIAGGVGLSGNVDATNLDARFGEPAGLAVDSSGNIYVADELNNTIRKITPSGTNWIVTTIAGGIQGNVDGSNSVAEFSAPTDVAVDASGRLYVADQFNNKIRLVTPIGTNWAVTTIAGQAISGRADGIGPAARFNSPVGVTVDSSNNVYVADLLNDAIRKVTQVGSTTNWAVETVAGGASGSLDGTGTNAQFNLPDGVAADAYGDVYVADTQNNEIRVGSSFASPPATGSVQVTLTPANVLSGGAAWKVDGGALQVSGSSLIGLTPGVHTISFADVTGFTTPGAQIVTVTARQTNATTANYSPAIANAGSLQVNISPAGVVDAGAEWQVNGGALQANGAVVADLPVGTYTLSFNAVPGWTTPLNETVTITNGQTTVTTGNYTLQVGSLQVTILPAAVVTAGAKWRVDGGPLMVAGTTLAGLVPGNHTVSFNSVVGWQTPPNQVINILNTLTSSFTATYTNAFAIPLLTGSVMGHGAFQFVLNGQNGSNYVIQTSSDLHTWTPISTNTVLIGSSVTITDPAITGHILRFYRAMQQ